MCTAPAARRIRHRRASHGLKVSVSVIPVSGYWQDLTTTELGLYDRARTVAILPVAAIEQHGPHLPLSTDALINHGIAAEALRHGSDAVTMLVLPALDIGHSLEHKNYSGTLTVGANTLLKTWCAVGAGVRSAGFRRLVLLNSHGGQRSLVELAAVRMRAQLGLSVARANYFSLGMPDELFASEELRLGIHGGEIETSLMLHIAPELVRHEHLKNFEYQDVQRSRNDVLSYEKPVGLGWLSEDLSSEGVVGNAAMGDAARGRRYLEYLGASLVSVCEEMLQIQLPDSSAK
jgi:creatinine amidohydrolase